MIGYLFNARSDASSRRSQPLCVLPPQRCATENAYSAFAMYGRILELSDSIFGGHEEVDHGARDRLYTDPADLCVGEGVVEPCPDGQGHRRILIPLLAGLPTATSDCGWSAWIGRS